MPVLLGMNAIVASVSPLGTPEMIILAILVLVMFGVKKLSTFARSLGRSMGEFRRAKEEFERELHKSMEEKDRDESRTTPEHKIEWTPLDKAILAVVILSAAMLLMVAIGRALGW